MSETKNECIDCRIPLPDGCIGRCVSCSSYDFMKHHWPTTYWPRAEIKSTPVKQVDVVPLQVKGLIFPVVVFETKEVLNEERSLHLKKALEGAFQGCKIAVIEPGMCERIHYLYNE